MECTLQGEYATYLGVAVVGFIVLVIIFPVIGFAIVSKNHINMKDK